MQASDNAPERRARLAVIVDHLERSERVLLDVANTDGPLVDVSRQQAWAVDLVEANRFYRDASVQAGELSTAVVLDDLERNLLDLANAPAKLTPTELDRLRMRLDANALLFKVRVLSDELRDRQLGMDVVSLRKTT